MNKRLGLVTLLMCVTMIVMAASSNPAVAYTPSKPTAPTVTPELSEKPPVVLQADQGPGPLKPVVGYPIKADVSPALHDVIPIPPEDGHTIRELPMFPLPAGARKPTVPAKGDPVLQSWPGQPNMPSPLQSFEGISNPNGVYPPDTQGDIGYDPATGNKYYVQWVNLSFAIWNVTMGTLGSEVRVYGPANGNTLWAGLGGVCETTNHGDPITLYDPLAHRWLMSQFSVTGPYHQCIAISQTGDPTGAWYRYDFLVHATKMNDYPKFGVWPDAYYMTVNQFTSTSSWAGAGVFAFNRAKMLVGDPTASFVYFDLYSVDSNFGGILPSDLDGDNPPPVGAPNYFAEVDDGSPDAMRLWKFHVDWTTPANSTFGVAGQPNSVLPVADFTPICSSTQNCIPQPGTTQKVDAIGDRLMYRLQYRNFGDHESLVTNHTVDAGSGRAGVRWYEVRDPGGSPIIYQQGTFAPADALHRWMGSVAMDRVGNLALGYSVASGSVYPSIRYTGRLSTDLLGALPQGETEIIAGSGSQTGSAARWGDYSMMGVDPTDDCTFWYTQEYIQTTGTASWRTRIASFKFPNCSQESHGTLDGLVRDTSTSSPIANALVQAASGSTQTYDTITGSNGRYAIALPTANYTVTASAYGYQPHISTDISVISGTTTTVNIALTPVSNSSVYGTVRDAVTGWPLYAHITILGDPFSPPAPYTDLWTDPVTGYYSATLAGGITYTFNINAWVPGYNSTSRSVGPLAGNRTENFLLAINSSTCNAPGYVGGLTETFDLVTPPTLPAGWATAQVTGTSGTWATNAGTLYPSGVSAHSTPNLAYFNSYVAISGTLTRLYRTSGVNMTTSLSAYAGATDLRLGLLGISAYGNDVHIDDVLLGSAACAPRAGGLVVGNTFDANTSAPLIGATVSNDSRRSTVSAATTDPAVPDSFYALFSPSGSHVFTATMSGGYGAYVVTPTVVQSSTIRQDLYLPAGQLSYTPPGLEATLAMGLSMTKPFTLTNNGRLPVSWELIELDRGLQLLGPFEMPNLVVKPFRQEHPNAQGLGLPDPPPALPYAAGDVIQSWPSGLAMAWGIAYDKGGTVWVSSPSPAWGGTDRVYEYTPAGTQTGRSYAHTSPHTSGPADMAFNWNTGMLWSMNVNPGIANCIYEVDPDSGYTGHSICPGGGSGLAVSQLGLAYDPSTDTWYAGSWNDEMIHHFDSTGALLDEKNVGLAISGLAYNPDTQHLFVMTSASPTLVYVLDTANQYAVLGQFSVPGLAANAPGTSQGYAGAGLEIDCAGDLWATDQTTQTIYQFKSGETTSVCARDVPWLSEAPISGTLASLQPSVQSVSVTLDASQANQPGEYHAQLKIKHNTPYIVTNIPVTLTVPPPVNWGKLTGAVAGLARCDASGSPLNSATILLQSSTGMTWTLTTDTSGQYQWWMDQTSSPLSMTISRAGYITQTITGIAVTAQQTATQNVTLRPAVPCINVNPASLNISVAPGLSKTMSLAMTNSGGGPADWALWEKSNAPASPIAVAVYNHITTTDISYWTGGNMNAWSLYQNILTSDVESRFAVTVVTDLSPATLAGFDRLLLPDNAVPDVYTNSVSSWFTPGRRIIAVDSATTYAAYSGFVWPASAGSNGYGVYWEYGSGNDDQEILQFDRITRDYAVGQVLGGYGGDAEMFASELPSQTLQLTAKHWDHSKVYVISRDVPGRGTIVVLGPYSPFAASNLYALVRSAVEGGTATDIPWLAEQPVASSVGADTTSPVAVTFSVLPGMVSGDSYTATLAINTGDVGEIRIDIPVTMIVNHLVYLPVVLRN